MPALLDFALGRRSPSQVAAVPSGLHDLVDALPLGVALFDASLGLLAANDRFASMLGLPPERLEPGMSFAQLVDACRAGMPVGAGQSPGLLMMDGKVPAKPRRFERVTPRGRVLDLQATALEGGGLMLAAQDITPLRAAQAQLQAVQATPAADEARARLAAQAARAHQDEAAVRELRQRFIAGMSHDLRTPLNALVGMLQLARGTNLTPVQADYLAKAGEAAQALLAVVGEGLDGLDSPAPAGPLERVPGALSPGLPGRNAPEPAQPHALRAAPGLDELGPKPLSGLRILLAEDNLNNQIVARELLTGQGARVEIAVDGLDTLSALVAGGEFDAILMDWQMPNMDGLEATREIRQLVGSQNIPVIALTANATCDDRQACLDAGMNAHLAKPVDVGQLVRTLLQHTRPLALLALEPHADFDPPKPVPVDAPDDGAASARMFELSLQEHPARPEQVLDRPGALERLGGSAELYGQVVALFRREVPNLLVDIADAVRGGQRPHVKRLAHTLKGTASTVGAMAFSRAAHAVEAAFGRAPGADEARLLAQLDAAAGAALHALPAGWDLAEIP